MASFLRAAHVVGRQATGIAPAAGVRAIGTVAPPTPSPAPSPYCSTFDFRRERQRADWWVNPTLEGDQLARNDEQRVNAALCSLKVVPNGASFRNLHLRGLRMLTPVSASKPYLTVDRKVAAKHKLFISLPRAVDADAKASLSFPEVAQFVDEDTSLAALRETRKHLSSFDTPKLFLHDGSINTGSAETLVRNVTDDSLIALTLSHTLLPTAVPNINGFAYSYSSLLSSSLPSSSLVDADLATTSFTLLDLERKIVVMGGQFAAPLLLRSLSAMSNYFVASQATGVPLPSCHSAVTTNGTSLVFGATQPVICPQLFGAHNNVWTQDGVSRSYNGALLDSVPAKYTPRAYDVLEKYSGNRATLISSHKTTQPYTAAHPKNVIFVVDDKIAANDALFTASAAQAVTLYKKVAKSSLLGVNIDSLATQFGALLETSKAKVYVVKASPNANDVQVAIANATSGAAAPKLDAKLFV